MFGIPAKYSKTNELRLMFRMFQKICNLTKNQTSLTNSALQSQHDQIPITYQNGNQMISSKPPSILLNLIIYWTLVTLTHHLVLTVQITILCKSFRLNTSSFFSIFTMKCTKLAIFLRTGKNLMSALYQNQKTKATGRLHSLLLYVNCSKQ